MKKIILILSIFLLANSGYADSTNIARLRAVGLSPEQTREIDAIYGVGSAAGDSVNSPVFILTPVAVTNQLSPGINIVPPTATAATQAFIGAAVAVVGQQFEVLNTAASAVGIKAPPNMLINEAGAGTTLLIASKTGAKCTTSRAIGYNATLTPTPGSFACVTYVVATPSA